MNKETVTATVTEALTPY